MTTGTCKNCRKPIVYQPEAGGYWYHPKTDRTWCYNPDNTDADPRRRYLKAEPR